LWRPAASVVQFSNPASRQIAAVCPAATSSERAASLPITPRLPRSTSNAPASKRCARPVAFWPE
jgi:hypothetical protein